jgi:hypothetical protein
MINHARHLVHRKYITEVAEDLVTRKVDYEEGLHIIDKTYQAFHKWTSHSNEEVINQTSDLKKHYKIYIEEQWGGDTFIYELFKEDVSDIVLSDLIKLAFCDEHKLINEDKYIVNKLLKQKYAWTTLKWYGSEENTMSVLQSYNNWEETKKINTYSRVHRHKYFKIARMLEIERRSR